MDLKKIIAEFDMILVGIGECFEEKFLDLKIENEGTALYEDFQRKIYLDNHKDSKEDTFYRILSKMIENKNYFIVTLSKDDRIYNSGIKKDRIVAPCGSYNYLQCSMVCTKDIFPLEEFREDIQTNKIAFCPHCGAEMVMNKIDAPRYSEEGYLSQWQLYTKWVQGTVNKKLLILELGVDMRFPSVIRWPFEKICYINQKSKMIRVNKTLFHMTEEIKDRGIGIKEEPIDFILNQIV